jgi:hypothetical protein
MCMSEEMPNSESRLLSLTINWMKIIFERNIFLHGLMVLLVWYVYQSANFLYGGYIWTEVYVTDKNEKIYP